MRNKEEKEEKEEKRRESGEKEVGLIQLTFKMLNLFVQQCSCCLSWVICSWEAFLQLPFAALMCCMVAGHRSCCNTLAVEASHPSEMPASGSLWYLNASPALSSRGLVKPLKSSCLFPPANWLHVHARLRKCPCDVFPVHFTVVNPKKILVYDLTTVTLYTSGFGKWYIFLNSAFKILI